MRKLSGLRRRLSAISPIHDYPVGLIHPYWARKPFNVVREIVRSLTEPGDAVADPFMGSGTTVFAALSLGRSVLASDINPLSAFLVEALLGLTSSRYDFKREAHDFLEDVSAKTLGWFSVSDNEYMERERFKVAGDFRDGRFRLSRTELVTKEPNADRWRGRKVYRRGIRDLDYAVDKRFIRCPVDFDTLKLGRNPRIAIPEGARVSHYFTEANMASINVALEIAGHTDVPRDVQRMRRLILSSALPLLRLSDKKASSQWPYWRPKKSLTSRNPVMVLEDRVRCLSEAIDWLRENTPTVAVSSQYKTTYRTVPECFSVIRSWAIQNPAYGRHYSERFELVLTDPPYSDQIPYLEYSALWLSILGLELQERAFEQEIVRTDSPERRHDTRDYINRLSNGLDVCCRLTKPGGHLVWFYQDTNLQHWKEIDSVTRRAGLRMLDVVPLPKQRRSMKTVTSPGRTLDGDLICIFKKDRSRTRSARKIGASEVMTQLEKSLYKLDRDATFFDRYAVVIRECLVKGYLDGLAERYASISDVLNEVTH